MRYLMNEFMGFPKDKLTEASESGTYEFVEIDENGVETVVQVPRDEVPEEILATLDMKMDMLKATIDADWLARRTAALVNTDYFD